MYAMIQWWPVYKSYWPRADTPGRPYHIVMGCFQWTADGRCLVARWGISGT